MEPGEVKNSQFKTPEGKDSKFLEKSSSLKQDIPKIQIESQDCD